MRARKVASLAWMALAPWLGACAAATPRDGATAPAESAIATVHASRCGACHTPPDPKTRSRAYVEEALSRHRKRVRLSSEEWAEMANYLAIPEGKTARQP